MNLNKTLYFCFQNSEKLSKAKSNYRGSAENQAVQKFYIHFFIDNSNADISLLTLSCPDFNLGQLKIYKMKFTLELSMKK